VTTARTHAVLVLNAGSSTIKYRLDGGDRVLASGLIERIGEDGARLVHRPADGDERVVERPIADHADGSGCCSPSWGTLPQVQVPDVVAEHILDWLRSWGSVS